MKRSKKLLVLLAVLAVLCIATFAVTRIQERQEQIRETGQVLLELPAEEIEAISWESDGQTLSFHRTEGLWQYDGDEAFPVDNEVMEQMLSCFEAFAVTFTIEDVEDESLYGLDDPAGTVEFSTAEDAYTLTLGDFSKLDAQRYISIGDGKVYLVAQDPMETFDAVLSDMIDHDEIPTWDMANTITFTGENGYTIAYSTDTASYCAGDVYFREGQPLDTDRVSGYLDDLSGLSLSNYVTYNATDGELESCGLTEPALTVTVEDFVLHVGLVTEETEENEETTTAYARVGDSPIVYQLTVGDQSSVLAYTYDDLRHQELFTAAFDTVTAMDITLDGVPHSLTLEDGVWKFGEEEVEIGDIQTALTGLTADSFTTEAPTGQEEIRLTLYLTNDYADTLELALYRQDGQVCLCQVNGQSVALVPRSAVVELVEAVNAIVL